jgi:hypothetical protein
MLAMDVVRETGCTLAEALQLTLIEAYQCLGSKTFWTPRYVDGQTA